MVFPHITQSEAREYDKFIINKERLIRISKCIDLWFAEDCGALKYDRSTSVKWQVNYLGAFIRPNVF